MVLSDKGQRDYNESLKHQYYRILNFVFFLLYCARKYMRSFKSEIIVGL